METLFRISKGRNLRELVGSVDYLKSFADQHGPGIYEVEELFGELLPGSRVMSRTWGSVIHGENGQVMITRRPGDPNERVRCAAFHEAGHAVILLEAGISIDSIEITPDGDEIGGGVDVTEPFNKAEAGKPLSSNELNELRTAVICLAAGSASEMIAFPSPPIAPINISISDVTMMNDLLAGLCLDRQAFEDFVVHAYVSAKEKLSQPEVWVKVEAIAQSLITEQKLSAARAKEISAKALTSAATK